MSVIDAHQHFWHYHPAKHDWINDTMSVIKRDFLPDDLVPLLQQCQINGCVAVQADQTEDETAFLVALANENDCIKGIVGWVDLCSRDIEEKLTYWKQFPVVKGFRHILQSEQPEFMLQKDFIRGIKALQSFGFTYDLLIFPKHLSACFQLVKQFPEQPFVINHMAKPTIRQGLMQDWEEGIAQLAIFPNVSCKISGLVTEADWLHWKTADFRPYLDKVVTSFGIDRLMYGSDWPVCLVAATYEKQFGIVKDYFASFSPASQRAFFGENATKFYQL